LYRIIDRGWIERDRAADSRREVYVGRGALRRLMAAGGCRVSQALAGRSSAPQAGPSGSNVVSRRLAM
jgi:hypothetical protein